MVLRHLPLIRFAAGAEGDERDGGVSGFRDRSGGTVTDRFGQ